MEIHESLRLANAAHPTSPFVLSRPQAVSKHRCKPRPFDTQLRCYSGRTGFWGLLNLRASAPPREPFFQRNHRKASGRNIASRRRLFAPSGNADRDEGDFVEEA